LVGLAYDFQEVKHCPEDEFDKKIQMILTPSRAIAF
jgi:5-formyltetrahydrofolate cyclo-ligase